MGSTIVLIEALVLAVLALIFFTSPKWLSQHSAKQSDMDSYALVILALAGLGMCFDKEWNFWSWLLLGMQLGLVVEIVSRALGKSK